MPLSANRIWRQLPNEIRVSASKVFWAETTKEQKQFLFAALAKANNVREISVRRAPIERLVNWTAATLTLPDQIANNLLQDYLLHDHRAMIVSYVESLGIPHSDGIIEEGFDLASLPKERVQDAARTLLASPDRQAAELYLKYLVVQGGPWSVIEEVLPTGDA
ncbi:MAG: hypothetical protein CXZ00_14610 [Acidobacteria bacterium]|nr:MAG: hypothetical protein CXZ00_14610 [Acidobacteriota bacterium]